MCGIAGIMDFSGRPIDPTCLDAMGRSLAHRGPDAQGWFAEASGSPSVGLVHRRLSIIDLSPEANQPLGNEDGRIQVVFNGEIYNFAELRERLEGRHQFRSRSDTEVIIHGYEEAGVDVLNGLDGMFAVAIWDGRARRLVLARDAFGKKPLYYWTDGRRLVFGSEIKAIFQAGVVPELDDEGLGETLFFGYVPTPRTLFKGIRKLPPASFMIADAQGLQAPRQYWDLDFSPDPDRRAPTFDEATERVRGLLVEAVRKRLVADVPIGVLLSGGLDSSAIAAIVATLTTAPVKTFTIGFEGDRFFDERPHAEQVARHVGSEHHPSCVKPDASSLMGTLLDHYDEPYGDSSSLPTYLVAREARKHVSVVINGDGGDETFAGYDRFHAALLADWLPGLSRRWLRRAGAWIPQRAARNRMVRRAQRFCENVDQPLEARVANWGSVFGVDAMIALDGDHLFNPETILSAYRSVLGHGDHWSLLSHLLYMNVRTYLLDDLLPKADRMTMAHGLEARSPLLDRPLMEYVASLPDHMKRQGQEGKIVLKRAVADLVPPAIVARKKQGFGVPLGDWFRGELRPLVEDVLLTEPHLRHRLRMDGVRALCEEHFSGRADWGQRLWSLVTLELWMRKYGFD